MAKKLQGQTAIITGAGRGIGAIAAERLASAGASLVLTARSEDQLEAVAGRIRDAGGNAIGVPADVSDLAGVEEVVESALDQFGRVDILINNAAVIWPLDEIIDVDPEEWAYAIHVNLVGPFYMARNVLPLMMEKKRGRILNISSGAALNPGLGQSAYNTSKAGLDMLTRALALEVEGTEIAVTGLRPGMVDTEMQSDLRSVDTSESRLNFERFHQAHEAGTLFSPNDVADLIYWMVGPWGRDLNGEILRNNPEWLAQVRQDIGT